MYQDLETARRVINASRHVARNRATNPRGVAAAYDELVAALSSASAQLQVVQARRVSPRDSAKQSPRESGAQPRATDDSLRSQMSQERSGLLEPECRKSSTLYVPADEIALEDPQVTVSRLRARLRAADAAASAAQSRLGTLISPQRSSAARLTSAVQDTTRTQQPLISTRSVLESEQPTPLFAREDAACDTTPAPNVAGARQHSIGAIVRLPVTTSDEERGENSWPHPAAESGLLTASRQQATMLPSMPATARSSSPDQIVRAPASPILSENGPLVPITQLANPLANDASSASDAHKDAPAMASQRHEPLHAYPTAMSRATAISLRGAPASVVRLACARLPLLAEMPPT